MQISILLLKQIAELFLMILMGFILVKAKVLRSEESRGISKIVLYLVIPCTVINAFQVDYTSEVVTGLTLALIASVSLHLVLLAVSGLLKKVLNLNTVEFTSIYYSNAGNLILPVVSCVLGPEWVIYSCVFMCVQLVFIWSHGKAVISGQKTFHFKTIFSNINLIAVLLGVVLFFTKIRLPEVLGNTVSSVSKTFGPLSMFVVGMLMAGADLKAILRNKRVYFISALRLLAIPLVSIVLLWVINLGQWNVDSSRILLITFFATATPSAATITQMCQVYGNDSEYASAINILSTLGAIITMPLMVLLFQTLIH